MPPAFVLSQNQTLKFMSDPGAPGEKPETIRAGFQGAVPALHIYCGYVTRHVEPIAGASPARSVHGTAWFLPIIQRLEAAGDRGRRPHVPSSKPTMSKSRRVPPPSFIRGTGIRLRETQTGLGRTPCPVGEAAIYVGDSNPSTPIFAETYRSFRVLTKSPPLAQSI